MLTHKGTVTLTTKRLILRRLTIDDVPAMFRDYATDGKMTKYLTWEPYTDMEKLREFVEKRVADYENIMYYHWAVTMGGEFIGTINLHAIFDEAERCEMGYCIGSKWWNKGVMTEAAAEVIRFAFEELNANKVSASHDTQNAASGAVMRKNGMKQEGLLREHSMRKDGTRGDMACYAILRSEWEKIKNKKYEYLPLREN
ncbi:MAG: GNAT family N-acetyltransferase [Oscillospiraceae bacterium]|nr:GNAT family N-acetyltransferase [Oscillospiraceae bacterium]